MYREFSALCTGWILICVVGFKVTGVQASPLPRRSFKWDPSRFIPLDHVMPGGQGVTYLSDLTQNLADDMSSQIALGSQLVSAVGDSIEEHERLRSDAIQHVSDVVDSSYKPTWVQDDEDEMQDENRINYEENEPEY